MRRLALILLLGLALTPLEAQRFPPGTLVSSKAAAAGGGYSANATTFAGDNQCWMERDAGLTGAADSKSLTLSFWVDLAGGNGTALRVVYGDGGRVRVTREGAGNTLRVTLTDSAGTALVDIETTGTLVAADGWHHVMLSVDKSIETRRHMYLNNVSDLTVHTFLSDDVDLNTASIDLTLSDWAIGDLVGGGGGNLNGCLSEFYMSTTYVDLSQSSNREIFYHVDGPPQDLTTVNSPIIYLKSVFSSFTSNSGSGGGFVKKGTTAFTTCTAP